MKAITATNPIPASVMTAPMTAKRAHAARMRDPLVRNSWTKTASFDPVVRAGDAGHPAPARAVGPVP